MINKEGVQLYAAKQTSFTRGKGMEPLRAIITVLFTAIALQGCVGGEKRMRLSFPSDPGPAIAENNNIRRGDLAIPGIADIPVERMQATRTQMQRMYSVAETGLSGSVQNTLRHGENVREISCRAFTVRCEDRDNFSGIIIDENGETITRSTSGTTAFSYYQNLRLIGDEYSGSTQNVEWVHKHLIEKGTKLVSISTTAIHAISPAWRFGSAMPYLQINSAGNGGRDNVGSQFLKSFKTMPVSLSTDPDGNLAAAARADKLILVAGWDRDARGNYIRHRRSSGCKGADSACVWAQFHFPGIGSGTSYAAPQFAAGLASVLLIAPHTTPQNLARFGKACVRKTGQGIENLLWTSGGLGVADFTCVSDVVVALANLPSGGVANVTVNGKSVTLSGREITLLFAGGSENVPKEADGPFFSVVPNGEDAFLLATGYRSGGFFTLLTAGVRDDFFGFTEEHLGVRQVEIAGGHENLFLTMTDQRSDGGNIITGAQGRSFSVTAQKTVALTKTTVLTAAAHADRFLGGEASIPLGTIALTEGDWHSRLSFETETKVASHTEFKTTVEASESGEYAFRAGIRLMF